MTWRNRRWREVHLASIKTRYRGLDISLSHCCHRGMHTFGQMRRVSLGAMSSEFNGSATTVQRFLGVSPACRLRSYRCIAAGSANTCSS